MGRAGGGSRPSHRSTSSHSFSHSRSTSSHSFSRSSGRSSSSSFHSGGRGRSGSSYSSSRIPVHTPVYVPPVRTHTTVYRDRTVYAPGTTSERTEYGGSVSTRDDGLNAKFWRTVLLFGFFFLLLFGALYAVSSKEPAGTASVENREKLDLGYGYSPDTLTDELGWITDPGGLNRNLKAFYDETGIVPYIALLSRPEVTAEGMDAEAAYAEEWYSEHLDHEGYVLLAYFDSGIPDVDGNAHLVIGRQTAVVMDAEAERVFWSYLDHYWAMDPEDMPEDELFANTFIKTGERIMDQRTETNDVVRAIFLFLTVLTGFVMLLVVIGWFRCREAEKAEQTAAILRAGREDLQRDSIGVSFEEADLLAKYGTKESESK